MLRNTLSAALAMGLLFGAAWVLAGEVQAEPKIAATVNGEAIYESQLLEGLPKKLYASTLKTYKSMKLERAMNLVMVRQFLTRQKIKVDDSVVDQQIAELRKNPPPSVCSCRVITSLEDFLAQGMYTLAEYREILRNEEGIKQYLEQEWRKSCPDDAARAKLAAGQRAALEAEYLKLWHIFFTEPMGGRQPGRPSNAQRAEDAWQRLEKGESFADLVKQLSDDKDTVSGGGYLGIVNLERSAFAAEATVAALKALKPGSYSQPVASMWGYHIIKREVLSDADVLKIVKARFLEDKDTEVMKTMRDNVKVECAPAYQSVKP